MIWSKFEGKPGYGQRGGIAILTALGFLLFSIPLITASLGLAQTTSIDARVKTDITQRHYCGLAVQEYFSYLLTDGTRWSNWLSDNLDPSDPSGDTSTETVDLCGENITVTVSQDPIPPPDPSDPPPGEPIITLPPLSAYANRDFQTSKTVSDPNPVGGASVVYTLNAINRDPTPTTLTEIRDALPPGFSYDCAATPDQLTLPGMAPQNIEPVGGSCPGGSDIVWDMPDSTSIDVGEVVTLTFTAVTNTADGTYCNEMEVVPGAQKTRSGKTAVVTIGTGGTGLCPGEAVIITKSVDSAALISTDDTTVPHTYTYQVDFTIKLDNIGTEDLSIAKFRDLLPEDFVYNSMNPLGDIINPPFQLQQIPQVDRQEVTWKFTPTVNNIPVPSDTSKTLKYSTIANVSRGLYWSDLLTDFGGGSFSEELYSWPTGLISIVESYNVTATDENGNAIVIALQVSVVSTYGVIDTWNIR